MKRNENLTKLQAGYLFPEVLFDALHKLLHLSEYPFVPSSLVLKTHFDRWTITAYCGPYCNAMVDRKCSVPAEAAPVTDDGRVYLSCVIFPWFQLGIFIWYDWVLSDWKKEDITHAEVPWCQGHQFGHWWHHRAHPPSYHCSYGRGFFFASLETVTSEQVECDVGFVHSHRSTLLNCCPWGWLCFFRVQRVETCCTLKSNLCNPFSDSLQFLINCFHAAWIESSCLVHFGGLHWLWCWTRWNCKLPNPHHAHQSMYDQEWGLVMCLCCWIA